jgi:hypothetical protein
MYFLIYQQVILMEFASNPLFTFSNPTENKSNSLNYNALFGNNSQKSSECTNNFTGIFPLKPNARIQNNQISGVNSNATTTYPLITSTSITANQTCKPFFSNDAHFSNNTTSRSSTTVYLDLPLIIVLVLKMIIILL